MRDTRDTIGDVLLTVGMVAILAYLSGVVARLVLSVPSEMGSWVVGFFGTTAYAVGYVVGLKDK